MTRRKCFSDVRAAALAVGLTLGLCASAASAEESPLQLSANAEAQGKLADALGALEQLPGAQRTSYVAELRRGWLLYQLGRHGASEEAYGKAIAQAPRAIEPRLGLLLPLLAERKWAEAQKVARAATRLDAQSYLANLRLAFACYSAGQAKESLALYRKLHELYPSDLEVKAGLGWSLLKLGKKAEAATQFGEILTHYPRHAGARDGAAAAR